MGVSARHPTLARLAGAIAGGFAWAGHQQLLGDVLHFDCRVGTPWLGLAAGLVALAAIAAGAACSWAARPRGDDGPEASNGRFLVDLSLLAAGLFALPVVTQTIATFMVPACPP